MIALLFHLSIFALSARAQISTLYLGHLKEKGTTRDNYDSNPDIIFPGIGTTYGVVGVLKEMIGRQMISLASAIASASARGNVGRRRAGRRRGALKSA